MHGFFLWQADAPMLTFFNLRDSNPKIAILTIKDNNLNAFAMFCFLGCR
jgi:hypothetical protein